MVTKTIVEGGRLRQVGRIAKLQITKAVGNHGKTLMITLPDIGTKMTAARRVHLRTIGDRAEENGLE